MIFVLFISFVEERERERERENIELAN